MKRVKRRYFAIQVISKGTLNQRELMDTVWGAVVKLYGEYGASLTGLSLIDYDMGKKVAIIRTNLVAMNIVRTSLTLIASIAGVGAAVHILAVSGTIKALSKKIRT